MAKSLAWFLKDPSGVTAVEYAVMAVSISLVLIAADQSIGHEVGVALRHAAAFVHIGHPLLTP